jgi:hypothetical protein
MRKEAMIFVKKKTLSAFEDNILSADYFERFSFVNCSSELPD